jgi:purine-binding chemotaxis protein CheW
MIERRATPAALETVDLACFELAQRQYAVPIGCVREILATPLVTPLPDAPALIEGVIDLRGHLVPILDLASLLTRSEGGEQGEGAASASAGGRGLRTVVVETGGFVVGFRVDRATRVVAVAREAMEPLPALTREAGCRVVGAVVRQSDRPPILVLELDTLIERVREPAAVGHVGDGVAA